MERENSIVRRGRSGVGAPPLGLEWASETAARKKSQAEDRVAGERRALGGTWGGRKLVYKEATREKKEAEPGGNGVGSSREDPRGCTVRSRNRLCFISYYFLACCRAILRSIARESRIESANRKNINP